MDGKLRRIFPKILVKTLKLLGAVLGGVALLALLLLAQMTVCEFRPKDVEPLELNGSGGARVKTGEPLKILTWNIGYGALGDNADFFMEGGTMTDTATKSRVRENIAAVCAHIGAQNPDFVFLQEVDRKSRRSHRINEEAFFAESLARYQSSFATNYKVLFVPYPLPPIGRVHSGIMTLSKADAQSASRVQLPCPFKYPVRTGNLKRCLLVSRIPVAQSGKELVLVNLHLEAYDSGEGKAAQAEMLREIFHEEMQNGNYVIAGGDFNQTFSTVGFAKYPVREGLWQPGTIDAADFDEGVQFAMDDAEPSCRSLDKPYLGANAVDFQFYVIDGFLLSANIRVESLKTQNLGFVHADHNPVELVFTLVE